MLTTGMNDQKPYHHGDLKKTLLTLALEILEKVGLENLSLRALAVEAGVSKNAPYRHFADKQALLRELSAEGFSLLADRLELLMNQADNNGEPLEPMRTVFSGYVSFGMEKPELYKLMFSRTGYSLHSERCRINAERAMGVMIRSVTAAQDAGWKPAISPEALVLSVWSFAHGWAGMINEDLIPEDLPYSKENWLEAAMALLDRDNRN